ncbi:Holliday junction branch migration protein RuvA [Ilumatobacteraceae bacterium]|jgi:Holliday junction DNA helicase RuvA|nr:Holliday junction branch migration protein RuvA [Ilumatobacteraceae bacterium]
MIATLRGTILSRGTDGVAVIEVGGVGYEVIMHRRTFGHVEKDTEIIVHVHHHIREDNQQLFGFGSPLERRTFRILIGTHGVGPALAMGILETHEPASLVDVIGRGDVAALTLVAGVGRKTAERLIIELRSRLDLPALEEGENTSGSSVLSEVRAALAQLGYDPAEVVAATADVPSDMDTATALRRALGVLGGRHA